MSNWQASRSEREHARLVDDPPLRTDAPHVVRTKYWRRLEDGRVQCDLCPRFCKLHEGQRGFCYVRANLGDEIVLTTYGRSSGYCVDPIEKKPLNHFLPGTPVLSFGTAGCNLGCKFCQNWDISKSRQFDTLADAALPDTIARAAVQLGCRSVAFTYNDPVIFHEYATDVAGACRARCIRSVAVTAGEICPEPRKKFFQAMDAANVDLKGFTERFYREVCSSHLQPVLDTLQFLAHETDVWLELTTLLIPGENDSEQELHEMTSWVVQTLGPEVPMHFTAFHPDFRMRNVPATPLETLRRARRIAKENGVRYAYTGNLPDPIGQNTCCHGCGQLLIGRSGYEIRHWNFTDAGTPPDVRNLVDVGNLADTVNLADAATCPQCGVRCAGVFESESGHWGNRRQPVRLRDFVTTSKASDR